MIIYLALGSNLGDRISNLKSGLDGLSSRGVEIVRSASIYLTEPRDLVEQPWFLNTIAEARTSLDPRTLLDTCLAVEQASHRKRPADSSKGPRTLDIDIIFYGDQVVRQPGLVIPHPRFADRRFVLVPLTEIAPSFIDP